MEVSKVVQYLRNFAPVRLAESWDNVGLLIEPCTKKRLVSKLLLTVDLTERVLEEAIRLDIPFIVSYHPPIFTGMKKFTSQSVKERIAVKAIEHGIAVYSPHTTYDALSGGVNDWLAGAVTSNSAFPGCNAGSSPFSGLPLVDAVTVLQPHAFLNDGNFAATANNNTSSPGSASLRAVVYGPLATSPSASEAGPALAKLQDSITGIVGKSYSSSFSPLNDLNGRLRLEFKCQPSHLSALSTLISSLSSLDITWEAHPVEKLPQPGTGQGRLVTLAQPTTLAAAIERIKKHLALDHVRVALPLATEGASAAKGPGVLELAKSVKVRKIALCAGSGSSVLRGVNADLYLTGEMGHHDVLDAVSNGTAVVLCEHSNTERGYLAHLREQLYQVFGGADKMEIAVSTQDADPLVIA